MPGTEAILRGVMDRWKAAIDAQRPDEVAAVFTADTVFQGLHPYSVGREGVAAYYASQTPGMTVEYQILETRTPAEGLVLGYLSADFAFPDRPSVGINLGVVVRREDDDWRIAFYQASRRAISSAPE